MQNIIKELLLIEKESCKLISDAKEKVKKFEVAKKEETIVIEASLFETQQKLELLEKEQHEFAVQEINKIKEKSDAQILSLTQNFELNQQKRIDDIFNTIIND